jgi:hypothetical protein
MQETTQQPAPEGNFPLRPTRGRTLVLLCHEPLSGDPSGLVQRQTQRSREMYWVPDKTDADDRFRVAGQSSPRRVEGCEPTQW